MAETASSRAFQGVAPSETAMFIFSIKGPLFARLRIALAKQPDALTAETWAASCLIDALGVSMLEQFQHAREALIVRQQAEWLNFRRR